MKEFVYRISPDGKIVQTISGGSLPFNAPTESVRFVRASHVRYDNTEGKWYIYLRTPTAENPGEEQKLGDGFATREEAIHYEHNYCNLLLEEVPSFVNDVLTRHKQIDEDKHDTSG